MNEPTPVLERLRKIAVLAEQGEAGEAKTAADLLEKLLQKHGVTVEQLISVERQQYPFAISPKLRQRILLLWYGYLVVSQARHMVRFIRSSVAASDDFAFTIAVIVSSSIIANICVLLWALDLI